MPGALRRASSKSMRPSPSKSAAAASSNAVCGSRSRLRAGRLDKSNTCTAPWPSRRQTSSGRSSPLSSVTMQKGEPSTRSGSAKSAGVKLAAPCWNSRGGVRSSSRASAPWNRSSRPSASRSIHSGMRVRPSGLSTPSSAATSRSRPAASCRNSRLGSAPRPSTAPVSCTRSSRPSLSKSAQTAPCLSPPTCSGASTCAVTSAKRPPPRLRQSCASFQWWVRYRSGRPSASKSPQAAP